MLVFVDGAFVAKLTGFRVLCAGVSLGLDARSTLSACLWMSRVVKRLDIIPRMWMIDCLLVELGCNGRQMWPDDEKSLKLVDASMKLSQSCLRLSRQTFEIQALNPDLLADCQPGSKCQSAH